MTASRDGCPERGFAGASLGERSRSGASEPRAVGLSQRPPGRSTLTESLEPAQVDAARRVDQQLEIASRRIASLEAANRLGDPDVSCVAASCIRLALRRAEQAIAGASMKNEDCASALERVASACDVARPALELAFTPSLSARREVADGAGRARWDREAAAWRAQRGRGDQLSRPGADPRVSPQRVTATDVTAGADPRVSPQRVTATDVTAGADPRVSPQHVTATEVTAGAGAPLPYLQVSGGHAAASARAQAGLGGAGPVAKSGGSAAAGGATAVSAGPWEHLFGGPSTPVRKLGRIQAPKGRTLLQRPEPGSPPSVPAPIPFDTLIMVVRRTVQPAAAERWCYVTGPEHGGAGFCEERYLAIEPPEPRARLHRVEGGETLGKIARDTYGEHIARGNDERLYVQALYEANKDRAGVRLSTVQLSPLETWHRREAEEETLRIYRGVQVLRGMSLWIPSNDFVQRLKAAGAITSGSSELSKAWRAAAEVADDAIEGVRYAAGFLVGLLEGAWSSIVDLFKGAVEMVEAIARTLYHLITGNPGRINDMLLEWVLRMKSAWEHRGQIADAFMKQWNAPGGWERGRFQGEILGWVMMTVLIVIATAGESAAASAGSIAARYPQVVKLLKTVDAVGDITTYLGGAIRGIKEAGKLPATASEIVRGKLGKADGAVDAAEGAAHAANVAANAGGRRPATIAVRGYAQGPRLQWQRNLDGAVRTLDEAMEIARRNGVEIPDDILLRKASGKYMPKDTYAEYLSRTGRDPQKTITWDEFYHRDLDQLLVRIDETVFHSDEAIVAVIGHEMHELNNLRRLFEESGGAMTYRRLHYLISPGIKGNLHDQAWDIADQLVAHMRKGKGGTRP